MTVFKNFNRSERRTYSTSPRVQEIRESLKKLQAELAMRFGSEGSYRRALEIYHELNLSISKDLLREYSKRGLLTKAQLTAIDKAREEAGAGQ